MIPSTTCVSCGACCASYRVSFYWSEADPSAGGAVPPELTEPATPFLVCMAGTKHLGGRCVALNGEIGREVSCAIYASRPSPCRAFGEETERCDEARARHGLPPLRPDQLVEPGLALSARSS